MNSHRRQRTKLQYPVGWEAGLRGKLQTSRSLRTFAGREKDRGNTKLLRNMEVKERG